MHSKISEVIHGSVLCLILISLSGATVSKIFVNISLKLDQASLIFEAKKQLSHLAYVSFSMNTSLLYDITDLILTLLCLLNVLFDSFLVQ